MTELYRLGAQLEYSLGGRDQYCVPSRVYHFGLRWDECEKAPNIYVFPQWAYDTVTRLDLKLGQGNYQLIIGVKCTPYFYSTGTQRNSPPKPIHYIDFARFIEAVCLAFHPYGIEIWNEPEFTEEESAKNAAYYGGFGSNGRAYGAMCCIIYDYLKGKDEPAQVITGASFGLVNTERALAFLREAVSAGMAADYWSWHGYVWYYEILNDSKAYYNLLWFADQAHAVFTMPQILSETSLMRYTNLAEDAGHRHEQANMLTFELRYLPCTPVRSVLWYTLANNGWRHTDLVWQDVKQPVYDIWKAG